MNTRPHDDKINPIPDVAAEANAFGTKAQDPDWTPKHLSRPDLPNLPGYQILGTLGRGGMGVVFKARQVTLNRVVALKLVLASADSRSAARFEIEAEAVAAIKHPHVVQVFEFGEANGQPFLAMEFLEGGSLTERIRAAGRFEPREAAKLLVKVVRGVQAAHDTGVIHRDLKPANILLDTLGEPKVTDFGLAKRAGGSDLTQTNAVMGTPAYMAPEQAKGETRFVGPAADIWALGVILYECLTGTLPFRGDDSWSVIRQVIEQDPDRLRSRVTGIPRDLELICLKCLAKKAQDRYPTAAALADDMDRFLNHEPVQVRPTGITERVFKWVRRNPAVAGLLLLVFAVTVGAVAAVIRENGIATTERDKAIRAEGQAKTDRDKAIEAEKRAKTDRDEAREAERKAVAAEKLAEVERGKAERQLLRADWMAYNGRLTGVAKRWEENHIDQARAILEDCPIEWRGWEHGYLRSMVNANQKTIPVGKDAVSGVAFTRDGQIVTGSGDKITFWETPEKRLRQIPTEFPISHITIDPTEELIAAGSWRGEIGVWELKTGTRLYAGTIHSREVRRLAFSPKGDLLASASRDGRVTLRNARTGKEIWNHSEHTNGALCVTWSPDGKTVVTGGETGSLLFTDAATGKFRHIEGHRQFILCVVFSPDEKFLATSAGRSIAIRNAETGELVREWDPREDPAEIAFSPDGTKLYGGGTEYQLRVWNPKTGEAITSYRGHGNWINRIAVSHDGRVVTANRDGTVKEWDLSRPQGEIVLRSDVGRDVFAQFSQDGTHVVSTTDTVSGGLIRVFDAASGKLVRTRRFTDKTFFPAGAFLGTEEQLHAVGLNGEVCKLLLSGRETIVPGVDPQPAKGMVRGAFSRDGQQVARGTPEGRVTVCEVETGKEVWSEKYHDAPVQSMQFDPVTGWLSVGYQDGGFDLLDPTNGKRLHTARVPAQGVSWIYSACVSPDRQTVAVASGFVIGLWDVKSGRWREKPLEGHTNWTTGVAFSADGSRLVSSSFDGTLRLWDVASGSEVITLRGHTEPVLAVSFSPDGQRLVSSAMDGTARIWDGSIPDRPAFLRSQQTAITDRLQRIRMNESSALIDPELRQLISRLERLQVLTEAKP